MHQCTTKIIYALLSLDTQQAGDELSPYRYHIVCTYLDLQFLLTFLCPCFLLLLHTENRCGFSGINVALQPSKVFFVIPYLYLIQKIFPNFPAKLSILFLFILSLMFFFNLFHITFQLTYLSLFTCIYPNLYTSFPTILMVLLLLS